jgi:hypothetical protein
MLQVSNTSSALAGRQSNLDPSIPPSERNRIFVTYTVDPRNRHQNTHPDTALPYQVKMVIRLTEQEIQDLDPETACILACLRESQYLWKYQTSFIYYDLPGRLGIEPDSGFVKSVKELLRRRRDWGRSL